MSKIKLIREYFALKMLIRKIKNQNKKLRQENINLRRGLE